MADYINASIICESYIFVPKYDYTEEKADALSKWLSDYAKARAPVFFSGDVLVEVELVPGSLKAKVKILGSIAAFFALYGGVRSTLDFLYKDGQWLAKAMATESMFATGKNRSEVGRIEIRAGVPGQLRRILNRIDGMQQQANGTSENHRKAFSQELAKVRIELLRVIETLPAEEDKEAVIAGFEDLINESFPEPVAPVDKLPRSAAIKCEDQIAAFLEELRLAKVESKKRRSGK